MPISVRNVSKTYEGSAGAVQAVTGVNLNIDDGEFVSVLGPSGCGKSTLLMMMAGLETASSGVVTVDGDQICSPRKDFGLVFQDATLLPWLTAEANVLFPIRMMKQDSRLYRTRARELLSDVGLGDFFDARPRELSGGMRQRVALCRSLIHDPTKLFMDEPFSALDAISRDAMGKVLLDLWERSSGTPRLGVFVTHSIREAVFLSDRVVVMGRRPATVKADITIPFERPRSVAIQDSPRFNEIVSRLRCLIDQDEWTGATDPHASEA
jgi:NitT/TauT family transport system ATP-binding protein